MSGFRKSWICQESAGFEGWAMAAQGPGVSPAPPPRGRWARPRDLLGPHSESEAPFGQRDSGWRGCCPTGARGPAHSRTPVCASTALQALGRAEMQRARARAEAQRRGSLGPPRGLRPHLRDGNEVTATAWGSCRLPAQRPMPTTRPTAARHRRWPLALPASLGRDGAVGGLRANEEAS